MSTNKLSHLTEGEKIYLEVTRDYGICDDKDSVRFKSNSDSSYLDDNDTFYTLDDLKQLANDGMPKQGDDVQVKYIEDEGKRSDWIDAKFIAFYKGKVIAATEFDSVSTWDEWRPFQQKTELTLAEVEEKLGLEKGSLTIKN